MEYGKRSKLSGLGLRVSMDTDTALRWGLAFTVERLPVPAHARCVQSAAVKGYRSTRQDRANAQPDIV